MFFLFVFFLGFSARNKVREDKLSLLDQSIFEEEEITSSLIKDSHNF